jgi:hypothetical protein
VAASFGVSRSEGKGGRSGGKTFGGGLVGGVGRLWDMIVGKCNVVRKRCLFIHSCSALAQEKELRAVAVPRPEDDRDHKVLQGRTNMQTYLNLNLIWPQGARN